MAIFLQHTCFCFLRLVRTLIPSVGKRRRGIRISHVATVRTDCSGNDTAVIRPNPDRLNARTRGLCASSRLVGPARADLKKMAAPQTKKVVLESEHPYSHNADRKETVRIEGAKKLIVSFDDRSR